MPIMKLIIHTITDSATIIIPYVFAFELSLRVIRYIPKIKPISGIRMAHMKPKTTAAVWLFSLTGGAYV